jgi:hypothetical protein
MGFIEWRRGGYRARYRDPLGRLTSKTFTRKADAELDEGDGGRYRAGGTGSTLAAPRCRWRPGPRSSCRRFEFAELGPDGTATSGGYAPYLDYRPLTDDELELVGKVLADPWLGPDAERAVLTHAVEVAVPTHLAQCSGRCHQPQSRQAGHTGKCGSVALSYVSWASARARRGDC